MIIRSKLGVNMRLSNRCFFKKTRILWMQPSFRDNKQLEGNLQVNAPKMKGANCNAIAEKIAQVINICKYSRRLMLQIWVALFILSWAGTSSAIPFVDNDIRYEGKIDFVSNTNGPINDDDYFIGEFSYFSNSDISGGYDTQVYQMVYSHAGIGSDASAASAALSSVGNPNSVDPIYDYKLPGAIEDGGLFGYSDLNRGAVEIANDNPYTPVLSDSFTMRTFVADLTYAAPTTTDPSNTAEIPVIFEMKLIDYDHDVFDDSNSKSGDFLSRHFDEFDVARFSILSDSLGEEFIASGNIYAVSVLEPTTLTLMAIGLAGIGFTRRRKAP